MRFITVYIIEIIHQKVSTLIIIITLIIFIHDSLSTNVCLFCAEVKPANNSNNLFATNLALPIPEECRTYKLLNESNRNRDYAIYEVNCDNSLSGWYRFGGGAGIKMPTTCVPQKRCGTKATGWISGTHPEVADGKVSRTVCFHWWGKCCTWSKTIEVVNCGQYYVYKLSAPPKCTLRYCGSNNWC